jgi:hypothetical protein
MGSPSQAWTPSRGRGPKPIGVHRSGVTPLHGTPPARSLVAQAGSELQVWIAAPVSRRASATARFRVALTEVRSPRPGKGARSIGSGRARQRGV